MVKGLGHLQRAVLVYFSEHPNHCGADYLRAIGVTPQSPMQVKHYAAIRTLRERGLITTERDGMTVQITVTAEGMSEASRIKNQGALFTEPRPNYKPGDETRRPRRS